MRGDWVEVLVDVGGGVERFEITATRAGRRVDISPNVRGTVEVSEVTRSGRPIRSARFITSRVVAIVEHPADEGPSGLSSAATAVGRALPVGWDGPSAGQDEGGADPAIISASSSAKLADRPGRGSGE